MELETERLIDHEQVDRQMQSRIVSHRLRTLGCAPLGLKSSDVRLVRSREDSTHHG